MSKSPKLFVCTKCGAPFTKMVGGFVLTSEEQHLLAKPVCDKCKNKTSKAVFRKIFQREE